MGDLRWGRLIREVTKALYGETHTALSIACENVVEYQYPYRSPHADERSSYESNVQNSQPP